MKKILLLLLVVCFAQNTFSQKTKTNDIITIDEPNNQKIPEGAEPNSDYTVYNTAGIDVKPEFPGGRIAFENFIKINFKIPKEKSDLKGKIYTVFVVEKDGSLSDFKILRDLGYETASEAIRVLKKSPKWTPGRHENKLVRVLYSVPLLINMSETK
nr:energy transducer TonB [uncultured Flavobacterium sp.]